MILKEFDLLEKQVNLSDIDFLEIKLLKVKYYNYTAKYNKALEIIDELGEQQKEKLDIYFRFNCIIEKLKVYEALDKIKESYYLIEEGKIISKIFENESERKFQLCLANYFLIVGVIYQKEYQYDQALEFLNKSLDIFQTLIEPLGIAEVLYKKGLVNYLMKNFKESIILINESIEISKNFNLNMYTAWALAYKAMALFYWGKKDNVLPFIFESLSISKKLRNIHCEDFAITILAYYYRIIGELDKALKINLKSLRLREIRGNKIEIAYALSGLAQIYIRKGFLKKSERYLNKAMKYPEVADHPLAAPLLLDIKARLLAEQGKYSLATEHFNQAIVLFEKSLDYIPKMRCFHYLISMALIKDQQKQAYKYLEEIKQFSKSLDYNPLINKYYLLEEAIIYKNSRDTYKEIVGKQILQKLISSDITFPEIKIEAIIHYLEILIKELKTTKNQKILGLIETMNTKILYIANLQKKYIILSEINLFQANVEIYKKNYTKGMEYFTKALKYAKKIGLKLLIMKISQEYDILLNLLNVLDTKQQIEAKIVEKINIFEFQFLFSKITRNLQMNFLNTPEIPLFLVIWNKIDRNLYEIIFDETNSDVNDGMIENLFREYKTILKKQFLSNPTIDRLKHDQITIVENKIKTIRFDYGFQGYSYHASRKLDFLIQNFKIDEKMRDFSIEDKNKELSHELKEYIKRKVTQIFLKPLSSH